MLQAGGFRGAVCICFSILLASWSRGVNVCSDSVSIAWPASFCTTYELLLAPVALVRASSCLIETLIHTPVFPGLITLVVPSLHSFSSCAQRRLSSFRLTANVLIPSSLLCASFAGSVLRLHWISKVSIPPWNGSIIFLSLQSSVLKLCSPWLSCPPNPRVFGWPYCPGLNHAVLSSLDRIILQLASISHKKQYITSKPEIKTDKQAFYVSLFCCM